MGAFFVSVNSCKFKWMVRIKFNGELNYEKIKSISCNLPVHKDAKILDVTVLLDNNLMCSIDLRLSESEVFWLTHLLNLNIWVRVSTGVLLDYSVLSKFIFSRWITFNFLIMKSDICWILGTATDVFLFILGNKSNNVAVTLSF